MSQRFLNFLKSLAGIITRPGKTLGTFMEQQKWGATLVLLLVGIFIFTYIMVPSQMAKLSRMVEMSEEYMPFFQTDSVFPRLMTGAMAAMMVFISISIGAFFVYLFYGIGGSEGTYSNFFALVVNASVIDTLIPGFLRMLFSLGLFPLPGAFSLAHLLPGLESKSFAFLALSRIELFSIWYIAAIAAGAAVFAKMNFKKGLFIGMTYFLFKAAISSTFAYLFIQIFKTS